MKTVDFVAWLRRGETEDEHDQRVVDETGELVKKDCIRLAWRHNGWMLRALCADRQSEASLEWRKPDDWKRDVLDELEFMEQLGLVFQDDEGWWYSV